jgi:O-antigen ligase
VLRGAVMVVLFAAPLALGSVHEIAFVPLLAVSACAGLASLWWAHRAREDGAPLPAVPGSRLLVAFHALVVLQLVPLPVGLLKVVSPGSFAFYDSLAMLPLTGWRPISVNPADTGRGLAFLAGFSLLYVAVYREFQEERWRRRLCATVVAAGATLSVVGLVQAASLAPTLIYGLWRPRWDWGVFGPYVSKNHFAGYIAMAAPLALAFAAEALVTLSQDWRARRVGWISMGGPSGNALLRRGAVAMLLVVGLLASRSRGGLLAFVLSALTLPLALRQRRAGAALVVTAIALGVAWVGTGGGTLGAFRVRGLHSGRLGLWADIIPMLPRFPVFGAGFNAFGTAYMAYQTVNRYEWYGEAHDEYLQALVDTGLVGAALATALLVTLFRRAVRAARLGPRDAGRLTSLLALCLHNTVDFNWQIPANAATFVALAALAARRGDSAPSGSRAIALPSRPPA